MAVESILEFSFTFFRLGSRNFNCFFSLFTCRKALSIEEAYFLVMLEGMLYGVGAYRWLLVGALRNECSAFAGGDVDYSLGLSFGFSLAVYDFFLIQYSSASLRIFSALRIASLDSSLFFL